jgi:hypothetical protein
MDFQRGRGSSTAQWGKQKLVLAEGEGTTTIRKHISIFLLAAF